MRRLSVIVLLISAACTAGGDAEVTVAPAPPSTAATADADVAETTVPASTLPAPTLPVPPPPIELPAGQIHTTYHRLDGNRYALGVGAVPQAAPVDVALPGTPIWIVGVPDGDAARWLVSLDSGEVVAVQAGQVETLGVSLTPGAPFAAAAGRDGEVTVLASGDGESPLTHPVLAGFTRVAIPVAGGLAVDEQRLEADPLLDARIIGDPAGRVVVFSGPTDVYPHAVLGDAFEASTLTFVDSPGQSPARAVDLPAGLVAEGISPIWADLDADGGREVIVTLSDARDGARIAVVADDGAVVAEGPPIGRGQRWRHQIAVAPFGPDGELELAAVRTPHIGGIAEFYRLDGDALAITAEVAGVTSHVFLTRNLDLALAADADGDGRVELVAPTDDLESLAGVRHEADGARVAWTVPLGGRLATNLAAVELPGGALELAAGTRDGMLRIWPGPSLDGSPEAAADRMLADVAVLVARGARVAGTPAERAALDHVLRTLRGWYPDVGTDTVELPQGGSTHNAWVTAGTGPTRVLLGAHYDSKEGSPGADDNGSGVAVLLELARRLALDPPEGLTVDLVFFGGEEIPVGFPADQHHFGSRALAARLEEDGMLPDYMVSVDMVGVGDRLLALPFRDSDPAAAEALVAAAGDLGVIATLEPGGDVSDHEAFAQRGVPSVFMWRPDNPAYHTADDLTVRPELLLEDLRILERLLANLG